jgi:hypothetical protein
MDFDDFLSELGASPSVPTTKTDYLDQPAVNVSSTNFSIDDDELDSIFSTVSSKPSANNLSQTNASPLIPTTTSANDILNIVDQPIAPNASAIDPPAVKSDPMPSETTKSNDLLDIAGVDVVATPSEGRKDLVGVSSSKILESWKFSPSESDMPEKYSIPPRSLMDVFNATYVEKDLSTITSPVHPTLALSSSADPIDEPTIQPQPLSTTANGPPPTSLELDVMAWMDDKPRESPSIPSAESSSISPPIKDYTAEIDATIRSSFPDIQKLRQLLFDSRHIPAANRCTIWNILLTGSSIEDLEAKYYHLKEDEHDAKNFAALVQDADAVMHKLCQPSSPLSQGREASPCVSTVDESFRLDLIDVISLYCLRKNIDYNPLLLQLLLPLAYESRASIPRTLLSSSFYNLIDNFVPLARLNEHTTEPVLSIIHFWLRLLVGYHLPKLLQHLDRVLPGWEQPCRHEISSTDMEEARLILRNTSNLDQLERDLGLDSIDDPFGWNVTAAPFATTTTTSTTAWSTVKGSTSVENLKSNVSGATADKLVAIDDISPASEDSAEKKSGLIAHNWIAGNFTGSLPPSLSLIIYDWAILHDERYAGLFLIVSLLEVFSDSLLSMNGVQITAWMHAIASGHEDWYRLLPSTIVRKYFSGSPDKNLVQWKEFIAGWLHVASAVRQKSPSAFTKALTQTNAWTDTIVLSEQTRQLSKDDKTRYEEYDMTQQSDAGNKAIPGANLLKKLRMQFQLDNSAATASVPGHGLMLSNNGSSSPSSIYPQEKYNESQALCLWSSPSEVLPSLTANRRRAVTTYEMIKYFDLGVDLTRKANPTDSSSYSIILPKPDDSLIEMPFYFGIDCRTKEEKELLGIFPRTYAFDPRLLSDSDEVTKLLETLDPLASSVHLCLLGAGEDFYKWHESYQQTLLQQQQQKKLWGIAALGKQNIGSSNHAGIAQQNVVEERSKLNALAMFFLKKSFRHVSILEGGFTAALRQIYNSQSIASLSNCLIDSNVHVINSLLGYDVNQVGTVVHAAPAIAPAAATEPPIEAMKPAVTSQTSSLSNLQKVSESFLTNISAATNNFIFMDTVAAHKPPSADDSIATSQPIDSSTDAAATAATPAANAKDLFSGFTRKLSVFGSASFDTIKKSVAAATDGMQKADSNTSDAKKGDPSMKSKDGFIVVGKGTDKNKIDRHSAFVIDDEDEDGDDEAGANSQAASKPSELRDTHSINIQRTDTERQQALILHKLAGLCKGEQIEITRDFLPGAILFPCHKVKRYRPETAAAAAAAAAVPSSGKLLDLPPEIIQDEKADHDLLTGDDHSNEVVREVHRYLVVTKERFMVLDADGGGVGSPAIVKSNHHLTEVGLL